VRRKLGESLLQAGLISEQDLQIALAERIRSGERIGATLVRLDMVDERQVARALAHQLGVACVNLSQSPPDSAVVTLIPRPFAVKRVCIAVRLDKDRLTVATADPSLLRRDQDLESRTGYRITPAVATRTDILRAIRTGYPGARGSEQVSREKPPVDAATDCRKCGQALQDGWQFCPFCAASVSIRPAWTRDASSRTTIDTVLRPAVGGSGYTTR
jgi:type IV pilus assembly protein PilB